MKEKQELLKRLSRKADEESHPDVDVVFDVMNTISQKRHRDADERPLIWITGAAISAMTLIIVFTQPAWVAFNSPWASLIQGFPEVLL